MSGGYAGGGPLVALNVPQGGRQVRLRGLSALCGSDLRAGHGSPAILSWDPFSNSCRVLLSVFQPEEESMG